MIRWLHTMPNGLLCTIVIFFSTTLQLQQPHLFAQASTANNIDSFQSSYKAKTSTPMTDAECKTLSFLDDLRRKYTHQPTFLQAVEEMALSLVDLFQDPVQGDFYKRAFLLMAEPERIISFRVPWMDDQGRLQHNRGWRVEFSR